MGYPDKFGQINCPYDFKNLHSKNYVFIIFHLFFSFQVNMFGSF